MKCLFSRSKLITLCCFLGSILLLLILFAAANNDPNFENPLQQNPEVISAIKLGNDYLKKSSVILSQPDKIKAFCKIWNRTWITEIHPYYYSENMPPTLSIPSGEGISWSVSFLYSDGTNRFFLIGADYLIDYGTNEAPVTTADATGFYFAVGNQLTNEIEAALIAQEDAVP